MFVRPSTQAAITRRNRRTPLSLTVIILALAAFILPGTAFSQSANVTLLGQRDAYSYHSDIWGYTSPGGVELAIVGTGNGTSFVNVTNPAAPVEVLFVPGGSSTWRDIKTYDHYAYIVDDEAGDGLRIVNMANPLAPVLVNTLTNTFFTVHNAFVDEAAGILIAGARSSNNATYFFDVAANPTNPPLIYTYTGTYLHDFYSRDGIFYGAAIYNGTLNTYDMSALPGSLPLLDSIPTDDQFCHNVWLSDDGDYAFTTDEESTGHITVFDVSDPGNLVRVGSYEHPTGPSAIIHNVLVKGDYAYIAWYKNGLEIVDVSVPQFPSRVGFYDTFPGGGTGFDGQWGTYPFAGSGNIYCSDMSTGLYVFEFQPNFGRVLGIVSDQVSGDPLPGVTVSVVGTSLSVTTSADGLYKFSLAPGSYTLEFSTYGYEDASEPASVSLLANTTLDVPMDRVPGGSLAGLVRNANTLAPLAGASVEVVGTPLSTVADGSGNYSFPAIPTGSYTVRASALGFGAREKTVGISNGSAGTTNFDMTPSFVFDTQEVASGWTAGAAGDNASSGIWTRVDPIGTGGGLIQPEFDHTPAPGVLAWITGQSTDPGSIGENDVDNGRTTLLSPVYDLSSLTEARVSYYLWYVNDGNGTVDDQFAVDISSNGGSTWVSLEDVAVANHAWERREFLVSDFVTPSNQVRLRFIAADEGSGSIVEAGIDDLEIYDSGTSPSDVPELGGIVTATRLLSAAPNPLVPGVGSALRFQLARGQKVSLEIVDVQGRRVATVVDAVLPSGNHSISWDGRDAHGRTVPSGLYFQRFQSTDATQTSKLVVVKP